MATGNPFTTAQAPSLGLVAPDITQEQMQLARRQQIADLLRAQSVAPSGNTEMVSGWAVKKSPLEGLSKIAQALGANYVQEKVDSRQLELAKALQDRMGTAFDSMAGGSAPAAAPQMENRQDPNAVGPQPAGPSAPLQGVQAPVQTPQAQPQNPQIDAIRNQAKAAYLMGNKELANKLIENISTMTDTQRNMRAMGQDPMEMGRFGTAAARKSGIIELQPGTTAVDLATGAERFQPKVGEGIQLNNGQASEVPNYGAVNAGIEGQKAGAISAAQAGNKLIKVDTKAGPVMMTEAQAVQEAGGTAPKNPMAPRPGDSDQAMIYKGEMKAAQDRLAAAKTPEERTRAQGDIDGLTRETKRLGIKLQDDTSRKFGEQVASKSAESLLEGRDKAKAASDSLVGIQKARGAIAGTVFQGSGAETKLAVSKFINANIPGVNIDPEKVSNTDYLKSTLGASLLAEAKTLGSNPSNADASRINDIVGSITKDPGAMAKILDWRQEMAERSIKNHNGTVDDAETRGMTSPYDLRVKGPQTGKPVAKNPIFEQADAILRGGK